MRKIIRILSIAICLGLLLGSMAACSQSQNTDASAEFNASVQSQSESMQAPQEISIATEASGDTAVKNDGDTVVQAILDSYSAKQFEAGEIGEDDLQRILQSGAKAPSARNKQPWHFTVVTGSKAGELVKQAAEGNVVIIISGQDEAGGMNADYDCGLASAYLYLAAQSLGYGAHIYMSGVSNINDKRRDEMQIPDGYSAVMMVLIGNISDDVDAVTSASKRNPLEDMVTHVG